jgi:hypothetical protein
LKEAIQKMDQVEKGLGNVNTQLPQQSTLLLTEKQEQGVLEAIQNLSSKVEQLEQKMEKRKRPAPEEPSPEPDQLPRKRPYYERRAKSKYDKPMQSKAHEQSRTKKGNPYCTFCKKSGHTPTTCYKKTKATDPRARGQKQEN